MTENKDSTSPLELRRIQKPYYISGSDQSDSIPDDESDDAREGNETQTSISFTLDEERAVVRKLDYRLVLFLSFLYMLSFLDRSSERARSTSHTQYHELTYHL